MLYYHNNNGTDSDADALHYFPGLAFIVRTCQERGVLSLWNDFQQSPCCFWKSTGEIIDTQDLQLTFSFPTTKFEHELYNDFELSSMMESLQCLKIFH
jgi:hypothetical protein